MLADHLISIIIATYNYGHRIQKALESIRDQGDKQIEIVIVDDGSTDCTATVVKSFQADHPALNLQYYYQENKGAGAARNYGIKKANGEHLLILDADDYLLPDSLKIFRQAIVKFPQAGMIAAGHLSRYECNQIVKTHLFKTKPLNHILQSRLLNPSRQLPDLIHLMHPMPFHWLLHVENQEDSLNRV